jgi:predicted kinase
MEAVIFTGIQGSGKTTFYRECFFDTHVRISLDLLRTRERESILLAACLAARQPFVVDNTNVLASERARYVERAKAAGFRLACYFFRTELRPAIARNQLRKPKHVPVPALVRAFKRLEPPSRAEGFDELFAVELTGENKFVVSGMTE